MKSLAFGHFELQNQRREDLIRSYDKKIEDLTDALTGFGNEIKEMKELVHGYEKNVKTLKKMVICGVLFCYVVMWKTGMNVLVGLFGLCYFRIVGVSKCQRLDEFVLQYDIRIVGF